MPRPSMPGIDQTSYIYSIDNFLTLLAKMGVYGQYPPTERRDVYLRSQEIVNYLNSRKTVKIRKYEQERRFIPGIHRQPLDFSKHLETPIGTSMLNIILENYAKRPVELFVSSRISPSKIESLAEIVDVETDEIMAKASNEKIADLDIKANLGTILHYLPGIVFALYQSYYRSNHSIYNYSDNPLDWEDNGLLEILKEKISEIPMKPEEFVDKETILEERENELLREYMDPDKFFDKLGREFYSIGDAINMNRINNILVESEYSLETQVFILQVLYAFKCFLTHPEFKVEDNEVLMEVRELLYNKPGILISAIMSIKNLYDLIDWDSASDKTKVGDIYNVLFEANIQINCLHRPPTYFSNAFSHFIIDYKNAEFGEKRRISNNLKKSGNGNNKSEERIPLPSFENLIDILGLLFTNDNIQVNDRRIYISRNSERDKEKPLIKLGCQIFARLDMVYVTKENGKDIVRVVDFKTSTEHIRLDLPTKLNAFINRIAVAMLFWSNNFDRKENEIISFYGLDITDPDFILFVLEKTRFDFLDMKTGRLVTNDEIFGKDFEFDDAVELIKAILKLQEVGIVYKNTINKELKKRALDGNLSYL